MGNTPAHQVQTGVGLSPEQCEKTSLPFRTWTCTPKHSAGETAYTPRSHLGPHLSPSPLASLVDSLPKHVSSSPLSTLLRLHQQLHGPSRHHPPTGTTARHQPLLQLPVPPPFTAHNNQQHHLLNGHVDHALLYS